MLVNLTRREVVANGTPGDVRDLWDHSPNWLLGALAYLLGSAPEGLTPGPSCGRWSGDALVITGSHVRPLKYFRAQDLQRLLDDPDPHLEDDLNHLAYMHFEDITGAVTRELFPNRDFQAALGEHYETGYGHRVLQKAQEPVQPLLDKARAQFARTQLELIEKHRPDLLTPVGRVEVRRIQMLEDPK